MTRWRWRLFAALANHSCSSAAELRLPPDRVTEVKRIVKV
jgi:K+ transporter